MPTLIEPSAGACFAFAVHGFFCANLVANTFIDLEFRILPDRLTFPLMAVGIGSSIVLPELQHGFAELERVTPAARGLLASLAGLGLGYGVAWLVQRGGRLAFGKEALGSGDVKLMAGIGAFLGWDGALLTFFLGCVFGAVVGLLRQFFVKDPYLAFGPYLAIGAVVTLFLGEPFVEFLTVTWPAWQSEHASSPWLIAGAAMAAGLALILLIRRGRIT